MRHFRVPVAERRQVLTATPPPVLITLGLKLHDGINTCDWICNRISHHRLEWLPDRWVIIGPAYHDSWSETAYRWQASIISDRSPGFIGLNQTAAEALAEKHGVAHRVVSVDGKVQVHFMDYRPGRINFWLDKRKVVKTTRG